MALGFMRRHRRWLVIFLWLVIAAFIILYIPPFEGAAGSPGEVLATLGDESITAGEFQRAYFRARQEFQGRLDEATLRRLRLPEQVFDALVVERLVSLEARRLGLSATDESLAHALATAPEFQEDGRFLGGAEIRRRLEWQGIRVSEFEESVRRQLVRRKLEGLVADAVSVTDAEIEAEFRRRNEQVKLEYVLADAARFREAEAPSAEEIAARFEADPEAYRLPERRVLSYVLLDAAGLRPRVTVSDADIELYYREQREDFRQEGEACASHILIKVRRSLEAEEGRPEPEARAAADELLARIRAGADFAQLARGSSEDLGSAPNGGDLGCFGPGRMLEAFDDAVFGMEVGSVSDVVQTPHGFHVIKLHSRRDEAVLPLDQVKERVREIVTLQKVERLAEQMAEALHAALARGRSLEEAARQQGLPLQKTRPFAKGETPEPLVSPALSARAFALRPGETEREGFALPQGAAFVALDEVQASRVPELEEVEDRVRRELLEERTHARARELAERVRAQAERVGLERAAAAHGLVRKQTPELTPRGSPLGDLGGGAALERAAFSQAQGPLSEPVRVAEGWAVLRVLERTGYDPVAFEEQKPRLRAALREQKRGELFQAYLSLARERYPLQRRVEAFRRVVSQER
jgi:peptidyl-prolyl cis-trans isomerase D